MLRSSLGAPSPNSKQSGGIHVVKPEERKGKTAVGRVLEKRKVLSPE